MGKIAQNIELTINKELGARVAALGRPSQLRALGELIVGLIIKRTQAGYDIYSRSFGGYNRSYDKKYAYRYARKKGETFTKYASKSKSDKLQLTGQLLSSIKSKVKFQQLGKNKSRIVVTIYISGREEQEKAEGLMNTTGYKRGGGTYSKKSWDFFGLAVSGTYSEKEQKRINKFISNRLRERTIADIQVK